MKEYGVYVLNDVDGGFGDSVTVEHLLVTFPTVESAEQYAVKWDRTHVYSKPYDELLCGSLIVRERDKTLEGNEDTLNIPPWEIRPSLSWQFEKQDGSYYDAPEDID